MNIKKIMDGGAVESTTAVKLNKAFAKKGLTFKAEKGYIEVSSPDGTFKDKFPDCTSLRKFDVNIPGIGTTVATVDDIMYDLGYPRSYTTSLNHDAVRYEKEEIKDSAEVKIPEITASEKDIKLGQKLAEKLRSRGIEVKFGDKSVDLEINSNDPDARQLYALWDKNVYKYGDVLEKAGFTFCGGKRGVYEKGDIEVTLAGKDYLKIGVKVSDSAKPKFTKKVVEKFLRTLNPKVEVSESLNGGYCYITGEPVAPLIEKIRNEHPEYNFVMEGDEVDEFYYQVGGLVRSMEEYKEQPNLMESDEAYGTDFRPLFPVVKTNEELGFAYTEPTLVYCPD